MAKAIEFTKMHPGLKSRWVEALRSGKYTQGRDVLLQTSSVDGDKYCCLGVLARLQKIPKAELLGALSNDRCPLGLKTTEYLVDLNDTREWSFPRIASWIEKYL